MGFFDNAANQAVPGGGLTKPLLIAAAALLAARMFGHSSAPAPTQGAVPMPAPRSAPVPQPPPQEADGGLLGGLGSLVEKFRNGGHTDVINSWIGSGQNQPIAPGQLGPTLGQPTITDLAAKAGMSEQELLRQLSQILPGLIDKLTPQGRLPTQAEIDHFGR